MLLPITLSENEFRSRLRANPRSLTKFVHITQGMVMLWPIAASILYYPADVNFLNRIQIDDPDFQRFVAICCFIAELCLYEVKTAKFGEMLGMELHKLSYLLTPTLLKQYIKDNRFSLFKHSVVALISLESSYVYGYLSQELVGNDFLSLSTVIAKFTTFHFSLIEMCDYFQRVNHDRTLGWIQKATMMFFTLLLGVCGATYVYGKSEVAFEELTANRDLSIIGAGLSVIPTAFLTGTSLLNFFKEISADPCKRPTMARVLQEILFCWFALTAAAPNAYFLEDWGRDKLDSGLLWTLVIIVGFTSLLTKRDALTKSTEVITTKSNDILVRCKQRFFPEATETTPLIVKTPVADIPPPYESPFATAINEV